MRIRNTIKVMAIAWMLTTVFSCSDDECGCIIIDSSISVSYINDQGTDLLDPDGENSYKEENIDLYRLNEEGEKVKVYYANLTHPEAFHSYYNEGLDRNIIDINLYPEGAFSPETVTYFIDFGNGEEDKIEAEIKKLGNGYRLLNVRYNDVLVWEYTDNDANYFEIVK